MAGTSQTHSSPPTAPALRTSAPAHTFTQRIRHPGITPDFSLSLTPSPLLIYIIIHSAPVTWEPPLVLVTSHSVPITRGTSLVLIAVYSIPITRGTPPLVLVTIHSVPISLLSPHHLGAVSGPCHHPLCPHRCPPLSPSLGDLFHSLLPSILSSSLGDCLWSLSPSSLSPSLGTLSGPCHHPLRFHHCLPRLHHLGPSLVSQGPPDPILSTAAEPPPRTIRYFSRSWLPLPLLSFSS